MNVRCEGTIVLYHRNSIRGNTVGVFHTEWPECEKQVKGFKGALYRSFTSKQEAEEYIKKKKKQLLSFLGKVGRFM